MSLVDEFLSTPQGRREFALARALTELEDAVQEMICKRRLDCSALHLIVEETATRAYDLGIAEGMRAVNGEVQP